MGKNTVVCHEWYNLAVKNPSGVDMNDAKLISGDHICSIYQNRQQQFSAIIPFIKDCLLNKQKCIYVTDDCSVNDVTGEFEKYGFPL